MSSEDEPLVDEDGSNARYCDEYLEKVRHRFMCSTLQVGFGRYQMGLLVLCGWANASDAVELMGVRGAARACSM